jgi:hypothetical protein
MIEPWKRIRSTINHSYRVFVVVLIRSADIPELIRNGKINHAIVINAFCLYFSRNPEGLRTL